MEIKCKSCHFNNIKNYKLINNVSISEEDDKISSTFRRPNLMGR